MRKISFILLVFCTFFGAFAQTTTKGVKLTIGAAANTYNYSSGTAISVGNNRTLKSMTFQIGSPFMGVTQLSTRLESNTYSYTNLRSAVDVGFPWGQLFINKTFSNDQFTVSKGYFSDRVEINWRALNNTTGNNALTSYVVYRTEDLSSSNPVWGEVIKTVSRTENTFIDLTAEGGKLYRYKLKALGVVAQDADSEYNNYITGVGYRNPTGIVSGNISFLGGNPVKDVLVTAIAEGGTSELGTSLVIPSDGNIWVPKLKNGFKDAFTTQVWLNYANASASGAVNLFKLISNSGDVLNSTAQFTSNGNSLTINVGSATFTITGYIPTGKLNNRGDDILETVASSINRFIHVSIIYADNQAPALFINGRPMTASYFTYINSLLSGTTTSLSTSGLNPLAINTNSNGNAIEWTSLAIGGGISSDFDDVRIWSKALTNDEIRITYKRYLRGDENSLKLYLRFNENGGQNVYDMSYKGSVFNGNDGQLTRTTNGSLTDWWNVNVPNPDQLGILGVTDINGNYSIAAIPYTGSGELFKITPSLGVHKFNPNQETLYIGVSSSVVNRMNFVDESSFALRGRILYDSRNVFPAGPSSDDVTGDIRDGEAYNAYVKESVKYPKGEYWAEYGLVDSVNRIVRLRRYAPIPLPGANVYIDDNIVMDVNNAPVMTDAQGRFNIKVPIGNHSITVKHPSHIFLYDGRFPMRDSTVSVNGAVTYVNTYKEFFEDNDEEVTFLDNTKVTLVGRVVGGTTEAAKPIGFGGSGTRRVAIPNTNPVVEEVVSSINNIGGAQITLGYRQPGASSITSEYKTVFNTNAQTGEYRVNVLPLRYELDRNDVYIATQPLTNKQRFLTENQNLNYSQIPQPRNAYFTKQNGSGTTDTLATSAPFQYRKDFIYRSIPEISVIKQLTDSTLTIKDSTFVISNTFTTPIYTQLSDYSIKLKKEEKYYNYDASANNPVVNKVPARDGAFVITNNIAIPGTETSVEDSTDNSTVNYSFKAGLVNADVNTNFKRTVVAKYRYNGTDYDIANFKSEGIVLGGKSDGSQGFITSGPDVVDFILRDPPGSGSSATLAKGTTINIAQNNKGIVSSETKIDVLFSCGTEFQAGIGISTKTEVIADVGGRFRIIGKSENGKTYSTSYTIDQSISTSSASDVVGASGDLYIGKSSNFFFGLYDAISATDSIERDRYNDVNSIPIQTNRGTKYISKSKGISFTPNGAATTFVYSQDYVLNTLLPFYEDIIRRIDAGDTLNITGLKKKETYENSIKLWKQAILRNEAEKYYAFNNKEDYKKKIKETILSKYTIAGVLTKAGAYLKSVFDDEFFKNISLDAKAGGYTSNMSIASTKSWSTTFEFSVGAGIVAEFGFKFAGVGSKFKIENENTIAYNYGQDEQVDQNKRVSYSLVDNDPNNVLSVDIINPFDGNGPMFLTQGGASSCPVEVEEKSNYFKESMLTNYKAGTLNSVTISPLLDTEKVKLSQGTLPLEVPDIAVERASISGVPETGKAAFKFTLANLSAVEPSSANFKLKINPSSNRYGARLSIDAIGVPISLAGSNAIEYTVFVEKGRADVYDYNNLEIVFESACDGSTSQSVLISASFIQSCTSVDIARPSNNWVMNATTSYNNGSTIPLGIVLNGFNTSYAGFEKIVLQYRMQGSPNWTTLKNYVANQTGKTAMITAGTEAAMIEIISGVELSFGWDVAALGLADGNYEIRAVSYCANGTIFETVPVAGKVDLISPVLFGTPSPTDGILSIGEDIKIRFSEPVKANGTMTRVDFLVQKNQLPVAHEVALSFTGATSKAIINSPYLKSGDISVEFWLKNATTSASKLIAQENGFNVSVTNSTMSFTVGSETITGNMATDGAYHHYTLAYNNLSGRFTMIEDDAIVKTEVKRANLFIDNNSTIVVGGTSFAGKAHDLRIWNTALSRETSVANMNANLNGNEDGLLGYWPMNEGHGNLANDLARYKHIALENVNWDIFPNGQSYTFDGSNHLALTSAARSIFSSTMDGTIAFWMKSNTPGPAALLSNGKGDSSDPLTTSGFRNKWSIELETTGALALKAENNSYSFGPKNLADGLWHHVAIVLKRKGNMSMYVDGIQSQNHPIAGMGGFSGSAVFLGGRGQISQSNQVSIDRNFTGQLDDIQIWNLARQADQINEDQYYEQDFQTTGLVLYAPLNRPEQSTNNGPKYYVPLDFQTKTSDYASLSSGSSLAYSNVTPAVKPVRNTERMVVNTVINRDEMIINPSITNWASIEKKIAYITVANMYDMTDNRQESPITWTAYINKNPLNWYLDGYDSNLDVAINEGKSASYDLVIANVGGLSQNYTIELPAWLKAKTSSGVISPNGQVRIPITIDPTLSPGKYFDELKLKSNYGFTEKIRANLRVLKTAPEWGLNPLDFEENMNVVSKVKVDGIFSKDGYDRVIAFAADSVRGVAPVVYDNDYDEYFAMLTIYGSTESAGTPINFKIWDASDGRLKAAAVNNETTLSFQPNSILGNYQSPAIFANSGFETQILNFNKGWTWLSFNVQDTTFTKLNTFFKTAKVAGGDVIKTFGPALFDVYNVSPVAGLTGWGGTISLNGGLNAAKMYRAKFSNAQKILATGIPVPLATTAFALAENWNGLPYVASRNLSINEALAYLDARDGDQIKSQSQFAIYDGVTRKWKGNLTTMKVGEGYMIKTSRAQNFRYPDYANQVIILSENVLTTYSSKVAGEEDLMAELVVDTKPIKMAANLYRFSETMNLVSELPAEFDGAEFYNATTNEVISLSQTVTMNKKKLLFTTLYGDKAENVKVRLLKDGVATNASNVISFATNALIGTLTEPYQFRFMKEGEAGLYTYPNPFTNELTLEFWSDIVGSAEIQIVDMLARPVDTKQVQVVKGMNAVKYNAAKMSFGSYIVKVSSGENVYTKTVIKN